MGDQKHHSYVRLELDFNRNVKVIQNKFNLAAIAGVWVYNSLTIIDNGFIDMTMKMVIIEIRCKYEYQSLSIG